MKVEEAGMKPAAVISDYNLSGGLSSIEAARRVSGKVGLPLPTIITSCRDDDRKPSVVRRAQDILFCPQANGSEARLGRTEDGSHIGAQRPFRLAAGAVSA
ncbi:MAG: hypothetical protein R3D30_07215 [Hyphomicrobiales bacterium]